MMQNETLTVRFAPEDTALETSAKLAQIARDSFIPEKKQLHLRSAATPPFLMPRRRVGDGFGQTM